MDERSEHHQANPPSRPPEGVAPVALITGAGSGIGLEAALALASRGWRLGLVGRRPGPIESAARRCAERGSPDAIAVAADMSDPAQIATLVDTSVGRLARVDALICSAGLAELHAIEDTDAALLQRTFAVNAFGPALAVARLWPTLIEQGGGRIVLVTSYATIDPFPGFFAYAQAKGAAMLQVKSIHNEGSAHGVRAFAVAPGAVETPMLRGLFSEDALPRAMALDPAFVGGVVADCARGARDEDSGTTIALPSPGPGASGEGAAGSA